MITSISGKIESGKDTVAKITQYLTEFEGKGYIDIKNFLEYYDENEVNVEADWQIKKFAGKLKLIVSLLTGIPVEDLEKQEVKDSYLGEEWNYWEDKSEYGQRWIYEGNRTDFKESKNVTLHRMKVRDMLQLLGTEALRNVIHPNVHVNALFADYKGAFRGGGLSDDDLTQDYPKWIISDLRFPNEAEAVKERGGITVRVNRLKLYNQFQEITPKELHPSETALDDYKFDYIINNDGTIEELVEKVKVMLQYYNII